MVEMLLEVPLKDIFADESFNCRGYISPASVLDLSKDIEANGLIQPIVIQPYNKDGFAWKVVCGHRRTLATKLLVSRRPDIEATIKAVKVTELPEHKALILNLKENMERTALNILQEAKAIERFKTWGWSTKRVADELGVYKKWVEVRFALVTLDPQIQERAEAGYLSQSQIEDIANLPNNEERFAYVRQCVDHKLKKDAPLKKKGPKNTARTGEPRSVAQLFDAQELVQDTLDDVRHPAAVALGYAAGVISLDDFYKHIDTWAKADGKVFVRPE